MFQEAHYDDNFAEKNPKKIIPKHPDDTQTDLLADFERVDREETKEAYMERQYAEFFGSNAYYDLQPEAKDEIRQAYKRKADEDFREKFSQQPETSRDRISRRTLEIIKQEKVSSLEASSRARQEEEARLQAAQMEREKKNKARLLRLQQDSSINLSKPRFPEDVLNEDGTIRDNKPGEEYYGRFKK